MKGTGLKNIILVLALCIPMHGASAYNHPDNLEKRLLALDKALEESGVRWKTLCVTHRFSVV